MRYDIRPINLKKSKKQNKSDYEIYPGHKSVVFKMKIDGDSIITGSKKGELKVMKFSLFKGDLSKAPSCISIRNWI